jgi:formate hydrogenlyase subunit 3/multisubunit Na+/H+ antiporter MnhD subunit
MTGIGSILLAFGLAAPLLMLPFVPFVRQPLSLLPWAAVPALAAALLVAPGTTAGLPMLLLGMMIGLDRIGAIFLGFGALLWCLGGVYARGYLADTAHPASFAAFWLLVLTGTLGTFIAADIVTFYASFSMMSLATYGLVVHDRSASARRAGRVYIVLAVLGETALLAGFMLAASAAGSILIADLRVMLAGSPQGGFILAGLLIGFGIKAGLVPLHVWLPLAHPEAPTPASAVLSGVIVTAGIIGLIRLLPADGPLATSGDALAVLGIVTAYYGVAAGLMQSDAKTILAYSTLSQMGLIIAVLGSGMSAAGLDRAADVATLYAAHHGLAKAALFLAVGITAASRGRARLAVIAVTAFAALSIAGLPLSGGALAKLAIKEPLGGGTIALAVSLSAIGTTMLMVRFLSVLTREDGHRSGIKETGQWLLVLPWAGAAAAALALPWVMFPALTGAPSYYPLLPDNLWIALWPILFAIVPAVLWQRLGVGQAIPRGDIVVIGERLVSRIGSGMAKLAAPIAGMRSAGRASATAVRSLAGLDAAEQALQRWAISGSAVVLTAMLIGLMLVM